MEQDVNRALSCLKQSLITLLGAKKVSVIEHSFTACCPFTILKQCLGKQWTTQASATHVHSSVKIRSFCSRKENWQRSSAADRQWQENTTLFNRFSQWKGAVNTVRTSCDFHTGKHGWSAEFTCDGVQTSCCLALGWHLLDNKLRGSTQHRAKMERTTQNRKNKSLSQLF